MFFVHTKTQNRLFKFLHWEDFQRFSFSWQVSVDGRPNLTLFLYGFLPGFRGQLISVTYPSWTAWTGLDKRQSAHSFGSTADFGWAPGIYISGLFQTFSHI